MSFAAARARDILNEERLPGVCLPWRGSADELREYVAWLLQFARRRWPVDDSPIGHTARACAVASLRLRGGIDALRPDDALRLVLAVAMPRRETIEAA